MELQPRNYGDGQTVSARTWQPVRPENALQLTDARLQFHYAAQFASAVGICFLTPEPDDGHTSLEWIPTLGGVFSHVVPAEKDFRVGVTPADLTLRIVADTNRIVAEQKLHGRTITEITAWLRAELRALGIDGRRYSLRRHYSIPRHDIAFGESFDASDRGCFAQLARWFSNGAMILNSVRRANRDSGTVRCWPHHFDIATRIHVATGRTICAGMSPGDQYYDEPYFYVTMRPAPSAAAARMRPLWGRGVWHTSEWIGGVLTGSRLGSAAMQDEQVREFIDSAISACRGLSIQS